MQTMQTGFRNTICDIIALQIQLRSKRQEMCPKILSREGTDSPTKLGFISLWWVRVSPAMRLKAVKSKFHTVLSAAIAVA